MKKCNKVRRLFGPYLYNSVTPAERAAVEEHVDKCEKCAHDLQSRRRVLEKIELHPQFGEMPQKTQDDFAWNVYRRIALGVLRRRSRRIFLRRFVLQPSLATLVLVLGIAMGILRFHPRPATILREPSPVAVRTDETDRKGLREALYVEDFFRRQGVSHEREPSYAGVDVHYSRLSTTKQPSSDADPMMRNVLLLDSRRRLEDANFINYSLGDRRRALAEYQRLVDYYPDTDAAMEARVEIRAILDTEYSTRVENADADQTTDMGI
jgi:hypothetical protein